MKTLATHLFERLRQTGVDTTFGIPGDFALPLYAAQAESGMRTIVCTHEPNVVFAAVAYARVKGLGVALTTYGAGGINLVNPVAMAYAEYTPVLVISGAPEIAGREDELVVHHLVRDYDSQRRIFAEVTVATASLSNAETAPAEIDRVLAAVMREKRPGYIEIPRDLTQALVPAHQPAAPAPDARDPSQETLEEALEEIRTLLSRAKAPVLYVGVGVRRNDLMEPLVRIAEAWELPVVNSIMGKSTFPESHPLFAGVYMGDLGSGTAGRVVQDSDCVLTVGVINSDVNTGFGTGRIPNSKQIMVGERDTLVFHHRYERVPMPAMIRTLAESAPAGKRSYPPRGKKSPPPPATQTGGPLITDQVIQALQELDLSRYSLLCDIGDAWFIGLELEADVLMASGYYASMGFAVPGGLGAAVADPGRRPLVIVGDGAFQMTGTEMSTLARMGINGVVLVLNNGIYKMLSALDRPREYYQIQNWDYVGLARSLGCEGERVTSLQDLRAALVTSEKADKPYLIEAVLDPADHAPIMRQIRDLYAARQKGDPPPAP